VAGQWLGTYAYRKQITIPNASVYGTGAEVHSNFPVLIDITNDDLRSYANGGMVVNPLGYDIVFSQDHLSRLNHEVESYDPNTGHILAWVQVPSLDANADNTLYLYFGNPIDFSTDYSTENTWDANYVAVYHLEESGPFVDASNNQIDGVNNGSADAGAIIEDGQDFEYDDTRTDRISLGSYDVTGNEITISAWINLESFDQRDARIVSKATSGSNEEHWWMLSTIDAGANYRLRYRQKAGASQTTDVIQGDATGNLSIGTPIYASAVYDGTTMFLYQDANLVRSAAHSVGGNISTDGAVDIAIGNQPASAGGTRAFDGLIDEVRIQSAARSIGWLQTEYGNQLNPGASYSVSGTEILNDFPCRAIEIPVNECYTPETFTNVGSTKSGVPDPLCGNYGPDDVSGDVWFRLEVPANGKVTIEVDTEDSNPPWDIECL
jgi:hypothetical protein